MMRKTLLVLAVSAALTAATFAASGKTQSTMTVGDFAIKVAHAMGKSASTPSAAIDSLKYMGVKISNADAELTEGCASRILNAVGVSVSTSNPNSALTVGKVERLVSVVSLVTSTSGPSPANGDLPTACLQSYNRGQCQECCKAYFGCDPSANCDFASGCAKFCKAVLPPGHQSPSDPAN